MYEQNQLEQIIEEILELMQLEGNNLNSTHSHFRDTFMSCEKEYLVELLMDDEIRGLISEINLNDSAELFRIAQDLVQKVENNLIPYEQMENVEKTLTVLLLAIKDITLVKVLTKVKERFIENDNGLSESSYDMQYNEYYEQGYSRSR